MTDSDKEAFAAKMTVMSKMFQFASKMTPDLLRAYWKPLERYSWEEVSIVLDSIIEDSERLYRPNAGDIAAMLRQRKQQSEPRPIDNTQGVTYAEYLSRGGEPIPIKAIHETLMRQDRKRNAGTST